MTLEELYQKRCQTPWNNNEFLPTFRHYAEQCQIVTEFGVERGFSTTAFLAAQPDLLVSYELVWNEGLNEVVGMASCCINYGRGGPVHPAAWSGFTAWVGKTQWCFHLTDCLGQPIIETDLLLIDSFHIYSHLRLELRIHSPSVRRWILIHDVDPNVHHGMDGSQPGLYKAVDEFLAQGDFELEKWYPNNNGLAVLRRVR